MSQEKELTSFGGCGFLVALFILAVVGVVLLPAGDGKGAVLGVPLLIAVFVCLWGFFMLEPNQAKVLVLFGAYRGTVRRTGLSWANPLYSKMPQYKVSLRARNFESQKLKVNDKRGNPIEIAAVIVWRVADTAKALFDIDNYEHYVRTQAETAIRHLASLYPYDHGEDESAEVTLRSNMDEVAKALQRELQERLARTGVIVDEARLTHLAYAPEIASAMLRRQQAEAIIAARKKIVHGAVSMVEMALQDITQKGMVQLDEQRKAAMVSNLLIVLCADREVTPVVNTGTGATP